ncbi:MAG: right-handed parallel beta-helix repeat-containing protein, partial [Opitutus sp.]
MQPRTPRRLSLLLSSFVLLAAGRLLHAQPSGGPYGPQAQTYEVPKDAAHVYYVAPDAAAEAAGTLEAPTSLEAAIAKVVTGDAIILRGGTYRTGGLVLNQGVTLQPYRDEKPVLKGTRVATKWEAQGNGMWRTS